MRINRDEARAHLQAGRTVAFRTGQGPGTTITPQVGKRATQNLPAEDVEGNYFLLRDESGNLTRAGMEQALREGGAVMYHGNVIETVDDLPDEVELVKGNERARKALADSLDAQLAALSTQRARLDKAAEKEQETPAIKQAEEVKQTREQEEAALREQTEAESAARAEQVAEHERDRQREALMKDAASPQEEQRRLAEAASEDAGAEQQRAESRRAQAQRERREREAREKQERGGGQ
jgi:hypothetical protein